MFIDEESLPRVNEEAKKVIEELKRLAYADKDFKILFVSARAELVNQELGCGVVDVDVEMKLYSRTQSFTRMRKAQQPL